jgi:hypothetical protein
MKFDITQFGIPEMMKCGARLREEATGKTAQEVARQVCDFLYDSLVDKDGDRACVLARFYVTHNYGELPADTQRFARKLLGATPWPALKCLNLLATRGNVEEWNDVRTSQGHRSIPLPSTAVVSRAPMIAQLFKQFGLDLAQVLQPAPGLVADSTKRTFNVFHVQTARRSQYIPAQEFVERHGVESVVGFGGALPWGEHFAVILFSRAPIMPKVAHRFKALALDVKATLMGFKRENVFDVSVPPPRVEVGSDARNTEERTHFAQPDTGDRRAGTFREFRDSNGTEWHVWAITPAQAGVVDVRVGRLKHGWLLFESPASRRRLSPIPDEWHRADDLLLEQLCQRASPARQRADD